MARDRQRAKQRKARRAAQNPGPAPSEPHRENVPGSLDHASGEADEFDAAIVSGAHGEPVEDDDPAAGPDAEPAEDERLAAGDEPVAEVDAEAEHEHEEPDFDEFEEDDEDDETAAAGRTPARTRASAPGERRGPGRFVGFLRASWAELQRVQWPDRRQVAQATAVVLGFVVVAGVYLGVADRVAQEVVDLII